MCQEFGHKLARYLWLKFCHEVTVKLSAWTRASCEGLTKAGDSTSKLTTNVVIGEPQFLSGYWKEAIAG